MKELSLLEFFKTGRLGSITLGSTEKEIASELGKPDDVHENDFDCRILRYGVFDFHLYNDELFFITCDDIEYIIGSLSLGKNVKLDAWKIKGGEVYQLMEMIELLQEENISFKIIERALDIRLIVEDKVQLVFEDNLDDDDDQPYKDWQMIGFTYGEDGFDEHDGDRELTIEDLY